MTNSTTIRAELLSLYSDLHKDARGFRPRGILVPATVMGLIKAIARVDRRNPEPTLSDIAAARPWLKVS